MMPDELGAKLDELCALPKETEWVEFKHNNSNPQEIGQHISALSNAAALHYKEAGFIVWGIEDSTHDVVGTTFRPRQKKVGNEELENWLLRLLTPRIDFSIFEFDHHGQAIVLFRVQPARHTPVRFKGEAFIRVGSYTQKLNHFSEKERKLWAIFSEQQKDWSAQACEKAGFDDLDPVAILFARKQFKKKFPDLTDECSRWDDLTFLNKAKVCVSGQITNTALLLLGKEESAHLLAPAIAQITWVLKYEHGLEKDYRHFHAPLILAVDQVYAKIRNLTYRYMPNASLFPTEITQYDPWVIRETLHNCIAHQDYTLAGRINVVEEPESLLFTNVGGFIPGSVEEVIRRNAPPEQYRNHFLAQAMVNLNMIDTIGSGIKRMFTMQRNRFFPMPDYDLSEPERIKVRLFGKVLDENYTRLLIEKSGIDLLDVIALDKVQKKHPLTADEVKRLKRQRLVEGRRPNLYVSARIAVVTGNKADYIKYRAFDKNHYKKMVVSYLKEFGAARRKDLDELLMNKISDALNDKQKRNAVTNLLQEMKREGLIHVEGTTRWAKWLLSKREQKGEI